MHVPYTIAHHDTLMIVYNMHDIIILQTSLLVVPQVFIECEVRVYDKRRSKDRANDDEAALRYINHAQ